MALSNLTICYEGVQRIYRNAIVRHVRKCLGAAYPADYLDRLRRPFEKEWEKIRASARERRETGEWAADILDDVDLIGVNHFFNIFDLYFDALCGQASDIDADQKSKIKQALLQWMKTV